MTASWPIDLEAAQRVANKLGLSGDVTPLASNGMVNACYRVGLNMVLRLPLDEEAVECIHIEILASRAIEGQGLQTPRLLAAASEVGNGLPPYTLYEWVEGVRLSELDPNSVEAQQVVFEVGAEAAKLRRLGLVLPDLPRDVYRPPVNELKDLARQDLTGIDALRRKLDMLAADAIATACPERLIHNDLHPWNVIVRQDGSGLAGILDWGDARTARPAAEFQAFPAQMLSHFFRGYLSQLWQDIPSSFYKEALCHWICKAVWEAVALDEAIYERNWWAWPQGGIQEFLGQVDSLEAHFGAMQSNAAQTG
ncbi:MAG: aminoglycoside phosphotransferase family protein [Armatimonadetes bacterium]|nr:aminoglycoside phosphotransferase family protein [Armatimonadota bacterium]